MTRNELISRINETAGKFFSLEYVKKDGTVRRISAQMVESGDPTPRQLKKHGYVVVRNTNAKRYSNPRSEYIAVAPHDAVIL